MKGYTIIISILVLVVSSLITLNIFFQNTLQMEIAEQFNKQQLLLANAEASNIQSYINSMREELFHVAHFISRLDIKEKGNFKWLTDKIFTDNGNIKTNIKVLDKNNVVLFSRGDITAERPYLSTFPGRGMNICSDDVYVEHDSTKVYITAPVCRSNSFDGAISLSVSIQDIAIKFLAPIKSGSRGYAWMMDGKGDLLYHPTEPGMIGKNLYKADSSCFTCHKSFDVEKKIVEGRDEYYGIYVSPSGEDKILAFSTASIGSSRWIVAVSAPYSEVTLSVKKSMKFYSWLIILIFITTSIVSALLIVFQRKRVKAEEVAKHQKELEKYDGSLELEVAKRTEELSSEKEILDTIVSAIGSGIVLIDNHGKIKWSNQTMSDMAGADLVGRYCEEICADCSIVGSYAVNELQTEIMYNLFGRSDKYFQVTTAPVKGEGGELHGYIRLVQDITEMKKMEEQMMNSEKLASLGRLTAGIAHEIGNPLTSVFSFVQILKEMEQDEFKKESLETIYFHIARIADILKQLSGFSKTQHVELKSWNLNNLIDSSLSLVQYDKRAKDVRIVKDLSASLPEINTDGNQLSQVFVNLILNAVDAMPEGGILSVRSSMDNGRIVIDFEDTGIGIHKENLNKIFDPFFTTKEKGTGLGLAVSYSIVRKLNGVLTVDSEQNKGSRFRITLPVDGEK